MNPTTRAALEACQAIFDRDPEAAQPLDEVDQIMRLCPPATGRTTWCGMCSARRGGCSSAYTRTGPSAVWR
jgi:hypothetical protein